MKKTALKKPPSRPNLPIILVFLLIALVVIVAFSKQWLLPKTTPNIFEIGSSSGVVNLILTPSADTIDPNVEKTILLTAGSENSRITAIEAELTYTAACGTPTVSQGPFLTNAMSGPTVSNGKINFIFLAPAASGGIDGSGTVASIVIKPTAAGTCTLTFTENTGTAAIGFESNALKTAGNSTITVASTEASAEASAAPAEASTQASAQASPSVSPTPTPSSLPSKTTTLRSTSVTCNSLSFSWDKIKDAKGYIIDLADNPTYDNKLTSHNLGSDKDSYTFSNLKNGTRYYARVSQTDIHDYPRFTRIDSITTLGTCAGAAVTPTKTAVKASVKPTVKPTVQASASPYTGTLASLAPADSNDDRFANADLVEQTDDGNDPRQQSLFARFIAWLVSIFE